MRETARRSTIDVQVGDMQRGRRTYTRRSSGRSRRVVMESTPFTRIVQIKAAYWRTSGSLHLKAKRALGDTPELPEAADTSAA